ncbi:MAG: hypothetical protein Q8M92_01230 [Candidatus Subteraquimicrobiales bacterium]|nr:hypothetical protein [Candidatus Subteraquimicrobiales bacterium]
MKSYEFKTWWIVVKREDDVFSTLSTSTGEPIFFESIEDALTEIEEHEIKGETNTEIKWEIYERVV